MQDLDKYKPNAKSKEFTIDVLELWYGKKLGNYLFQILNAKLLNNFSMPNMIDYYYNNNCILKYIIDTKGIMFITNKCDKYSFKEIIQTFFDFEIIYVY